MEKIVFSEIEGGVVERSHPPKHLQRGKVPGGWIIREECGEAGVALVFVPDPEHKWI